MPSTQKIGSFRPLTFIGNGKPVSPVKPQPPNRKPSSDGIRFSGKSSYAEFKSNLAARGSKLSPQALGRGAVKLQKASGISLNVTI